MLSAPGAMAPSIEAEGGEACTLLNPAVDRAVLPESD